MADTVLKLDPRLSEFDTEKEAESYNRWLKNKVESARSAPVVSHEEALAHFEKQRIKRLERLQNAGD
ncbi:type II toxin-antitoxin system RelB family antitoxin [Neisseria wadsworthii]|uniref:Stability determinant n=1 Tax=Neisseria wadsworthii 9715 TaxID=1030841 RepID=G4CN18_9NEIS|nr:hypothetical protein [Neisseria wadsworthii]EGZ50895.1 hypothetical protein HMPREF9370_0477 [Neisseria wadsworthii 9715]QMT36472.1 hypothetical protein H3L96_04440 [Neisseria wadsworthii]